MIRNQHSIFALTLAFLVVFALQFDANAQRFPEGRYKYTPAQKPSRSSSRSSLPGNVSGPSFVQGNTKDFEDIRKFRKNHPFYKLGRSVAFITYKAHGENWYCTGFLVGPDLLLTNHHCVFAENGAPHNLNTYLVLMNYYEDGKFGNPSAAVKRILKSSKALDYALLQLSTPIGNAYGWLDVSTSTPSRGTNVVIIQHPLSMPKQIVRSNSSITKVHPDAIHYTTDTERGSSGSPVFTTRGNRVIALHHAGKAGRHNEGILMKRIYPQIKPFIQNSLSRRNESVTGDLRQDLKIEQQSLELIIEGQKKYESRQYRAAIKDLDNAIRIKSDNPYAYYWRGAVKAKLDLTSEALQDLQTAARLAEKAENKKTQSRYGVVD